MLCTDRHRNIQQKTGHRRIPHSLQLLGFLHPVRTAPADAPLERVSCNRAFDETRSLFLFLTYHIGEVRAAVVIEGAQVVTEAACSRLAAASSRRALGASGPDGLQRKWNPRALIAGKGGGGGAGGQVEPPGYLQRAPR